MNRSTWILLAVLVACLGWAYAGSRPAATGGPEQLETVWNILPDDITKVDYRSAETQVTLSIAPRKGGQGTYLWVEGEGLRGAPPMQRKRGRKQEPPPPAEQPANDAFQGNPQARKFLEEVANLQAVRALGLAKDLKLENFGLSGDDKSYLQVERTGGAPLKLELGAVAPGNTTRYALSAADGRVYLVRNNTFRSLANVRRFMDRELTPFPVQEARQIDVQAGDRKVTLHRLEVPPTDANRWGRTPQDKAGDPALQEVVNALLRIKVLRYLPDAPDFAKATPIVTVTLNKGAGEATVVRLYGERKDEVPAVSTHTERPVALNAGLAKALVDRARAAAKP